MARATNQPQRLQAPTAARRSAEEILRAIDELDNVREVLKCVPAIQRTEAFLTLTTEERKTNPEDAAEWIEAYDLIGTTEAINAAAIWQVGRAIERLQAHLARNDRNKAGSRS